MQFCFPVLLRSVLLRSRLRHLNYCRVQSNRKDGSIGPQTTETLDDLDMTRILKTKKPSLDALIAELVEKLKP